MTTVLFKKLLNLTINVIVTIPQSKGVLFVHLLSNKTYALVKHIALPLVTL